MNTIKKYRDFKKAYDHGKSFGNRNLVLYVRKNNTDETRLGITISKKTGNAVVRNKIRRQIKEIYREFQPRIKTGYDLVFIVKRNVPGISFAQLKSAFNHILRVSRMYK